MAFNFRDVILVIVLLLNFYIISEIKKVYSSSLQGVNISENTALVIKKQSEALNLLSAQSPNSKSQAAAPAFENTISDSTILSMVKKALSEEESAMTSGAGNFDKQPDAVKLRQLQDRIDGFQKKFADKLGAGGAASAFDKDKMEKLRLMGAQIKEEVLNQCKKQ